MSHRGFSHIGLSTLDLDKTGEFYKGVLGFKAVIADTIKVKEGGCIRHIFFDTESAISLSPLWNHAEFKGCGQNTIRASPAGSGFRPPSIISLLRQARRLPSRTNAPSFAL